MLIGNVKIPLSTSLRIIAKKLLFWGESTNLDTTYERYGAIIFSLRLPRVLSSIIIGACLSIAGATMQGLIKNPLADGSILGVSSGASAGAVLAIISFGTLPIGTMPFFVKTLDLGIGFFAVLFAFLSLVIVMTLSRIIDRNLSSHTIVLVGIVFSMFASSLTSFLTIYSPEKLQNIVFWSMGSMQRTDWQTVYFILPVLAVSTLWVMRFYRELNAFALGEEQAQYVGVNVKRVKIQLLFVASMLVGVSVAVCGNIAFVGLIVPHIARKIVGANHKHLLPVSAIIGAIFLTCADIFARSVMPPLELPIGIVTSAVGAIFMLVVFFAKRRAL